MQQLLENLSRFICRFRYPVSLPEDIASDIGVDLPNHLNFEEFLKRLASPQNCPKHLWKWMRRDLAENAFKSALKSEIFLSSSLFSYYFSQGWVVIALYFDEAETLRRLYVQCPYAETMEGFDIPLDERKATIVALHTLAKKV